MPGLVLTLEFPMFDNLSERLATTMQRLRGKGRLTEKNISEGLREVRVALLEADVALPVVQDFLQRVKARALGQEVLTSLEPGQALVKVVNDELVATIGPANEPLNLNAPSPVIVLMAGLQGAGKTTTAGKLAKHLMEREKKRVMLVSCDVYRPAAIEQLKLLAEQVGALHCPSSVADEPLEIASRAVADAKRFGAEVLIVDTAGRLGIDERMMAEIGALQQQLQPTETLFVVDSLTGQDAANSAKAFSDALDLTGVVLTKTDGDARGGAALSVRQVTGKPIKYIGLGEKMEALEPFHPDRIASRILGMGDVLSLVEQVERKVDHKKAQKFAKKMSKGTRFTLDDFKDQLEQIGNMGGLTGLMDKIPGMAQVPDAVKAKVNDKDTARMIAIVNSMTPKERRFPDLIRGSRKRRIANGSGTKLADVSKVLKQFTQMQRMMKKMSGGGMQKMMKKMAKAGMPPGGMPGGGMGF